MFISEIAPKDIREGVLEHLTRLEKLVLKVPCFVLFWLMIKVITYSLVRAVVHMFRMFSCLHYWCLSFMAFFGFSW
jgi:hypothetical protein